MGRWGAVQRLRQVGTSPVSERKPSLAVPVYVGRRVERVPGKWIASGWTRAVSGREERRGWLTLGS